MNKEFKYVDVMSDFGFKRVFGGSKQTMISFLNEIFRGRKVIKDLEYSQTEYIGDFKGDRLASFDLKCIGDHNELFIIEIQRAVQENFLNRALFYTSRVISQEGSRNDALDWPYETKEVYLIAILEKTVLDNYASPNYLSDLCLCDRYTKEISSLDFGIIYLELSKFTKSEDELVTNLDKWVFALKNIGVMKKIPEPLNNPVFKEMFGLAELSRLSDKDREIYEYDLKTRLDNANFLSTAFKSGKAEGELKGKAEGKLDVARAMKKENIPADQIARVTGISLEEVKAL